MKENIKLNFLRLFDNPLSKSLISQTICFLQWLFWFIYQNEEGVSCTGIQCIISAWFFHKNVPYLILFHLTKFQCHIFSFWRYQTKCAIKFLFRQLLTSYLFMMTIAESFIKAMADRKKLKGSWKYKHLNISRMKRAF